METKTSPDVAEPQPSVDIERKRGAAIRLMLKGEEKEKTLSLLEECATLGDPESMLILAQCCAVGNLTKPNVERANRLLSESAEKGNKTALVLLELIREWKWEKHIRVKSL